MWRSNSYTDTGQRRKINEDALLELPSERLWLVADGMGGHASGDYASQLVTSTLADFQGSRLPGVCKQRLTRSLSHCNARLLLRAEQEQVDVIGCTVALLHARRDNVLCSWSGDSRIYRLRQERLLQLTRDHTQEAVIEDRDRLRYPVSRLEPSAMLTGAIGGAEALTLEHCWFALEDGDAFLLCTDGLIKEVEESEIREIMLSTDDGEQILSTLAALYQQRGARDNIGMIWLSQELK